MLTDEVCGGIGALHGQVPFLHSRRAEAYSVLPALLPAE
jgi:hypothetical protein